MIKTIKLPYKTEINNIDFINNLMREQSIVMKWSYNRFLENKNEKEIRDLVSNLNNIKDLDSWFIQSGIRSGKDIYSANADEKTKINRKVVFNKYNYIRRLKGLISNEEYKQSKKDYIYSIGEAPQKGNRKFELDLINNRILFKPRKGIKIYLELPNLRNNIKKELNLLETRSKEKSISITFKMDSKNIYIMFETNRLYSNKETVKEKSLNGIKPIGKRILGLDLNPNHIGISVLEFNNQNFKIIKVQNFDLSKLTDKKGNHNKLRFEIIEIIKKIINLCKHLKVDYISIEKLSMNTKDHKKGKNNNSLLNNKFLRNLFTEHLLKRSELNNIDLFKVGAYYSSYIGNLVYDYFDPVNASIEMARRGYETKINKNYDGFYPEQISIKNRLIDQWKESIDLGAYESWVELCKVIKNSKLRYRVSLEESSHSFDVLRSSSTKSKVTLYNFV
jgi:hypothetical protein